MAKLAADLGSERRTNSNVTPGIQQASLGKDDNDLDILDVLRKMRLFIAKGYKVSPERCEEIMKKVFDEAGERYSPKGRVLRKAFERPRPDLRADAPINRTRKQIALTLPPELVDAVTEEARARGVDRNRLIEAAIRAMLSPR